VAGPGYAPALINLATIYIPAEYQRAMDTVGLAAESGYLARHENSGADRAEHCAEPCRNGRDCPNNLAGLVKAEGACGRCRYRREPTLAVMEKTAFSLPGGIGTPSAGETICGMRATESTVINAARHCRYRCRSDTVAHQ